MSETIKAEKPAKDDQQQFWQMAIETWRTSGMSVRQFCTKEGLSEPSFYSWRKKLTGSDTESESLDTSPFIEVSMPQSNPTVIELLLTSGNTLRIPAGADSTTLSTVLSVAYSGRIEVIRRKIRDGMSQRAVARELGCSRNTVATNTPCQPQSKAGEEIRTLDFQLGKLSDYRCNVFYNKHLQHLPTALAVNLEVISSTLCGVESIKSRHFIPEVLQKFR